MLSVSDFIRLQFSERVIEQLQSFVRSKEAGLKLYNFLSRLNDYCLDDRKWVMIGDSEILTQLENNLVSYPIICDDGEYMLVLKRETDVYQVTELIVKPNCSQPLQRKV